MILRNFNVYLNWRITINCDSKIQDINGSEYARGFYTNGSNNYQHLIGGNNINYSNAYNSIDYSKPLLQLGSGNTPVTYRDYCLESSIPTIDTVTHQNTTSSKGNKTIVSHLVYNGSDEDIIVNELGIMSKSNTYKSSSTYIYFLITRTVLPEPVIIKPGETCVFTETIEMLDREDGTIELTDVVNTGSNNDA